MNRIAKLLFAKGNRNRLIVGIILLRCGAQL